MYLKTKNQVGANFLFWSAELWLGLYGGVLFTLQDALWSIVHSRTVVGPAWVQCTPTFPQHDSVPGLFQYFSV